MYNLIIFNKFFFLFFNYVFCNLNLYLLIMIIFFLNFFFKFNSDSSNIVFKNLFLERKRWIIISIFLCFNYKFLKTRIFFYLKRIKKMENKFSKDYQEFNRYIFLIDIFGREADILNFDDLYYFKTSYKNFRSKKIKKSLIVNYNVRISYFFNLVLFLKKNQFNSKFFLRILFNYYSYFWFAFLITRDLSLYYATLDSCVEKYNLMFSCKVKYFFINKNYLQSYLLNFDHSAVTYFPLYRGELKVLHDSLLASIYDRNIGKEIAHLNINRDYMNFSPKDAFLDSIFTINFIRVQRRYNKRRYSRVRSFSRSSFFAGISFSSILVGLFWGGTIKSVDWNTVKIINIDVNLFLFVVFFYFVYRIWRLYYYNNIFRTKNKIRMVNSIHNMFAHNFFIKNGGKKK